MQVRFLTGSSPEETQAVRAMITETIARLKRASVGSQHMGARYARLLDRLWRKGEPGATSANLSPNLSDDEGAQRQQGNAGVLGGMYGNGHTHFAGHAFAPTAQMQPPSHLGRTPTLDSSTLAVQASTSGVAASNVGASSRPYDFNWLDLDAVGQFALDETAVFSAEQMMDVDLMWNGWGFGLETGSFGGGTGSVDMSPESGGWP